jgi:hypothetical protein
MAIKDASAYLASLVLAWLSLLTILIGNLSMTSIAGAAMWYNWTNAQGRDYYSDSPPQAYVL